MSESTPPPQPKKRCTIYVDAFNWYFGIFQHHPEWKWLNAQSFFEALRLDEEVVTVKFFTALVDPLKHVSTRRDRQKRYLKALGTLPKVKIILGGIDWPTVKSVTIKKAEACYYAGGDPFAPSDRLQPYAALWATVDTGHGNIDVEIDCPIVDESAL